MITDKDIQDIMGQARNMLTLSEWEYRRGWRSGIVDACQLNADLINAGYTRPLEIGNILFELWETSKAWQNEALSQKQPNRRSTPAWTVVPWHKMRKSCFDRDGSTCSNCGAKHRLEAHHIKPVCCGGIPVLDNLKTLCSACHDEAHRIGYKGE